MRQQAEKSNRIVLRSVLHVVIAMAFWGALLFGAAGTFNWTRGWLLLGLWAATLAVNLLVLFRCNPELVEARTKRNRGIERFDIPILLIISVSVLALTLVAGFDAVRYGWSTMPPWLIGPGVVLHVLGNAVMLWAMAVNPFAEKAVRIQTDRDHRVMTTGPYAHVRHPMYTGSILAFISIPLILGSWWSFVPVAALCAALLIRTELEDRTLKKKLSGYREYTTQTRARLVPGLW